MLLHHNGQHSWIRSPRNRPGRLPCCHPLCTEGKTVHLASPPCKTASTMCDRQLIYRDHHYTKLVDKRAEER